MKLLLAILLAICWSATLSAAPDPRDSVILESKTVAPSNGPVAVRMRVWVTNKDTLDYVSVSFIESSLSGGAYLILAYPRSDAITKLVSTLPTRILVLNRYNSSSPDTLRMVAVRLDPSDPSQAEPPNLTRKPFWEIKFDTVLNASGIVEFKLIDAIGLATLFGTPPGNSVIPNYVSGYITVAQTPKGDLNLDFALTAADVVLILNCIMLGIAPPAGAAACDLNCDGMATAADFVLLLNAAFLGDPFPC